MKSYFFDVKNFQLSDGDFKSNGKSYPIFKMMIKVEDLKNSEYFSSISEELRNSFKIKSEEFYEIGKAIVIPMKMKLFYLWAESDKILKEMMEPIFKVEKIAFRK